jgi:hypothetical protein
MMVEEDGGRRRRVGREKSLYRMDERGVSKGGRVVTKERSTQVEKSESERSAGGNGG